MGITPSQEIFRFIVEGSKEEIYLVRPDGSVAYVNKAASESLGYDVEELLSLHVADFDKMYGHRFDEVFRDLRSGGSPVYLTEHTLRDGRKISKEIYCTLMVIHGEEFVCGFGRDVTERKKEQEALRESEKRFRDLAENTSDLIWETDEKLRFTYMNRTITEHLGVTPEDRYGKTLLDVIPPQEARRLEPLLMSHVANPRPFRNMEYMALHKDGTIRFRQTSGVPVFGEDGTFKGYRGITRDVTEERLANERLSASERRFAAVFQSSPVPMVISRPHDGLIVDCNLSFERWSGYTRDEAVGRTSVELALWRDALDRKRFAEHLLEQGSIDGWEMHFRVRGGVLRYALLSARLIELDGERLALVQVSDVTAKKELDEELARYRERLELLVKERTADLSREIEARKRTEAELRYREMELENRRMDLEEMNAALRVLLRQREEDKEAMESNVLAHVKTFIMPHIVRLEETGLNKTQRSSLSMIKAHLEEIVSPFAQKVSSAYLGLTPSEIQVASLIREGKTSKEIARILNISINTVQTYRYNIRRKTGIKNKKTNLRTFLKNLA